MKTNDDIAREEFAMKASKKGGAVKKAMGGAGKIRKGEMSPSGKPLAAKLPMKHGGKAKKK